MAKNILIKSEIISNNTLANLESRDVALWVHNLPVDAGQRATVAAFLGLPWRLVLFEGHDRDLLTAIESASNIEDRLTRRRGLVQIIDSDPTRIELPPRCLPIYLLDGRKNSDVISSFESRVRRMTMLEEFRRSATRELVIISVDKTPIPSELGELWSADYRTNLTLVSNVSSTESDLEHWLDTVPNVPTATIIQSPPYKIIEEILTRYLVVYPEDRQIIRMHDSHGGLHKVDVTMADEPERPIFDSYTLIQERNLTPLMPEELTQDEFVDFFKSSESSWRPYASGLPWVRDSQSSEKLNKSLQRLDRVGPDENCIAYIVSEPGAGGTTLARTLAWECARKGYPVLIAKPYPFTPDSLLVRNYLTRVHRLFTEQISRDQIEHSSISDVNTAKEDDYSDRHFETPWIIVFDVVHWEHRESELIQFRNELARSGRPVCLLIVIGPLLGLPLEGTTFKMIAELHHTIQLSEALRLGTHLNNFLRNYGREKTENEWNRFYYEHTTHNVDNIAGFWVTLSFWIRGQYDLSESIQHWIYSAFKEQSDDRLIQESILQIAAMSTERLPLPQALLPKSTGRWPVWQLMEDRQTSLTRLGLLRLYAQGEWHWAIMHDILGRLLLNALFYDYPMRKSFGYSEAIDTENLRFLILKKISENNRLGERGYRSIGEDFALDIFKVDPDHGKISFARFWREVLDTLDNMPKLLRDASRVFRHHTAVSRRRIAKLDSRVYDINDTDRALLLERAIKDINYALNDIPYEKDSESDLNLLNSLAHAYFDLAEIEMALGKPQSRISELKKLANEATLRAYRDSPSNSFTIETYVRSLLQNARDFPDSAMANCVTALGTLYSALHANIENARAPQLERLADQAIDILFKQASSEVRINEPKNAIEVLVQAWLILAEGKSPGKTWSLDEVPLEKQEKALLCLSQPSGQDNLQVLHLQYDLICNCRPHDYRRQIELLEPLQLSEYWMSPQLRLEYAILLFQTGRPKEGDRAFQSLRQLWRTSEQFVHVPERLHWLRGPDSLKPQVVKAIIGHDYGTRAFAAVREFANVRVAFRPEEHGFADPRPGLSLSCFVTFGHNGPFLRPLSANPPSLS